ncbi:MAG: FecR domain-containing protein [Deltaproteobacteria bacterium]|nr:FecR domain-containing protein [Deltaproteobacteria bacterium]
MSKCHGQPIDKTLARLSGDDPYGALGPLDDISRRKMVINAITSAQAPLKKQKPGASATFWRWTLAGAAAVCLTALSMVMFLQKIQTDTGPAGGTTCCGENPAPFGTFISCNGTVQQNGRILTAGTSLHLNEPLTTGDSGHGIVALPTGIIISVAPQSTLSVRRPDDQHLEVSLLSGELALAVDPHRIGPAFSVKTFVGTVEVKGTIFSVKADSHSAEVKVLRGKVAVTRQHRIARFVTAGDAMDIGSGRKRIFSKTETAQTFSALAEYGAGDKISSAPSAGNPLATKDDALTAATPGKAVRIQGRQLPGAKSSPSMKGPMAAPSPKTGVTEGTVTLGAITRRIRIFRQQKLWSEAADAYGELISRYPLSNEGQTALIALGDLQLNLLHQPENALRNYETYLAPGRSTLALEATYGKARSLRALGRTEEEKKVLRQLINQYSDSPQANTARARLAQLQAPMNH